MPFTDTDFLTTREVAALLRLKERKVYELASEGRIPCIRVTGKLLFPRALVEAWLMRHVDYRGDAETLMRRPPICAGSHDPLLDWALREAGTGLAVNYCGSLAGLDCLARGAALMAGAHICEAGEDRWNVGHVAGLLAGQPVVVIEWARRDQGLVVAPGNPLGLGAVGDLKGRLVIGRQRAAGAHVLLQHLLSTAGLKLGELRFRDPPARTEADVAAAVADGEADAGLAIAAMARQYRLDFVPLIAERYDLVIWRAAYFEEPIQRLLAFAATVAFAHHAEGLGGYDISGLGRVRYNGA